MHTRLFHGTCTLALASLASLAVLVAARSADAQTDFRRAVLDTGGGNALGTAATTGDIDGDGLVDVAVVHASADTLGLLRARPGGGFESPVVLATGDGPRALALVDVDHDGRDDVLVFNDTSGTLTLVRNTGGGPVVTTWPAGGSGGALAVGDLDGDGAPDAVTALVGASSVAVVRGLGAAGFAAPVTYAMGAKPDAIALADVDGDGALDVVAATTAPFSLRLRRGDGGGGLLPVQTLATSASAGGLVVADLDADGYVDVATGSGTDLMLVRNGPGGFGPPETTPMGVALVLHASAALQDGGAVDLLAITGSTTNQKALVRLPGLGGGAFGAPQTLLAAPVTGLVVDDVNGDARPDAVTLLALGRSVVVLHGDGAGGLDPSVAVPLPANVGLSAVADLDGDGAPDLVTSTMPASVPISLAGPVSVQFGDGAGGFGPPQLQPVEASAFLVLADLTGDGVPDLVTTNGYGTSDLLLSAGDGAGGFLPPSEVHTPVALVDVAAADTEGDGDLDLVGLGFTGGLFGNETRFLFTLRNDGGGQWAAFTQSYGAAPPFSPPDAFTLGDANGLGPDAIVLSRVTNQLWFLAGPAGVPTPGPFGFPALIGATPAGAAVDRPLLLADVDGDTALDLLVAAAAVTWRRGHGDGTFGATQPLASVTGDDLRWVDVDGDGAEELVLDGSSGSSPSFVVHTVHADGLGGFEVERYLTEATTRSFVLDADGDGRPDLLTVPPDGSLADPTPDAAHVLLSFAHLAAFTDFGHGLAGSTGVPVLSGHGTLAAGSVGGLMLSNANPSKLAVLFISPLANPTPFKGGVLVPVPVTLSFSLFTSPAGTLNVPWMSWVALPPGTDFFFQFGIVDVAGPAGASLSNALRALQP